MAAKCSAIARSGRPCGSAPLAGSSWCYLHDPAAAEARRESSRKGGFSRSNRARAKKAMPAAALTPREIEGYISMALRAVLAGKIEPGVGNAVANLARAAVAVREATELEARLAELELRAGIDHSRRRA